MKSKKFKSSIAFSKPFRLKNYFSKLALSHTSLTWGLLGAAIILTLALGFWSLALHQKYPADANTATLIISIGNDKRTFEGEVAPNMTVLDALIASARAGQIHLNYYINNKNETNIVQINGYTHNNSLIPSFYLNNQLLDQKDLNKTGIKAKDIIEVRIQ